MFSDRPHCRVTPGVKQPTAYFCSHLSRRACRPLLGLPAEVVPLQSLGKAFMLQLRPALWFPAGALVSGRRFGFRPACPASTRSSQPPEPISARTAQRERSAARSSPCAAAPPALRSLRLRLRLLSQGSTPSTDFPRQVS